MKRLLVIALLLIAPRAWAACTGSSPTWTATTPSNTDLQTCVDNASDGDTINVAAGSATWSGDVTVPNTKGLQIIGAGAASTTITNGGSNALTINTTSGRALTRVSGIRWERSGSCGGAGDANSNVFIFIKGTATNWRIDNNIFDDNGIASCYSIMVGEKGDQNNDYYTYGVIDSNTFTGRNDATSIHINWARGSSGDTIGGDWTSGNYIWSLTAERGTARAVYIEDNTFTGGSSAASQVVDTQYGGQYVLRYNSIDSPWISTHSGCTNGGRNTPWTEVYKNTFSEVGPAYAGTELEMRSTSAVVWGNTSSSTIGYVIGVDHERSYRTDCLVDILYGGRCDGTEAYDENTSGQSGGRCNGQPGWGPVQNQSLSSATFAGVVVWDNLNNGSEVDLTINNNNPYTSTHLVFQRELFDDDNVTVGLIADRPSTCSYNAYPSTSGRDIYISTDENSQGATVYQCSATNTWTKHWEPYTYPHPLRDSAPDAPTNFRLISWLLPIVGVVLLGGIYGKVRASTRRAGRAATV
jgi:hypothetical protein